MVDLTLPLPGLSPIAGKEVVARFDGGRLSSDGGLLLLREIERRLAVAERLAACIEDRRDPGSTLHTLADIIRFRLLMIAAGYEDGNDATSLRIDPVFKMALERLPSGRDLCSQSTISRLENLPDIRTLLRLGGALVDLYCGSFRQVPRRITLDIDDTFDAVHGGQQLRLFNAHYDDYGFQPIVVFDADGRFVTAVLRPAKRPKGVEIRAFLRRLVRAIRGNWPQVAILLRADSHYACPEVLDWCEANGIDYVFGLAPTSTWKRHVGALEASTLARFKADAGRWQGAPLQGVLRRRTHLEPGPPHRRPRRGRQRRHRYPLHRHHPRPRQRPLPLPGPLLPARPGGKPCMDACRAASAFFVVQASMVSCCHVSGLQCGRVPLASMRFAGRLPTIKSSSRLCGFPGFCRPTVRPSCHRVEDRPRSSWKLATPPILGVMDCSLRFVLGAD